MTTRINTPIPQDKIGESFVWRDWFQKLSNVAFGTAAGINLPVLISQGGTSSTTDVGARSSLGLGTWALLNTSAPTVKAADFSVGATDTWLINNKPVSSCVVTLPAASSSTGRVLYFVNYQAFTVVSSIANVVQLSGGAPTSSILIASIGAAATLVSDGTNWIRMQ